MTDPPTDVTDIAPAPSSEVPRSRAGASLRAYLEPRRQRVDRGLADFLGFGGRRPLELHAAMRYAVLGDGKRLRPILCIAGAEICGGGMEDVLPTACALELIHACSLVHDDLPALDGDELRRGQPSCHARFGPGIALLAGDALFSQAFELLVEQRRLSGASRTLDALAVITGATGTDGMVAGQVEDMLHEGKPGDEVTLEFIHTRKAGALIRAALVCGGLLVGGDETRIAALGACGGALGHAFQVVDDILGESGDAAALGKPVGADRQRGKLTYPALLGLERSWVVAGRLVDEALEAVAGLGPAAEPLRELARYVLERAR
ncbi:MAG: polyprenyl synthetase family protein [Polyangiaceae bacterium]|nr:polyprenyl synthetase family protein [Polyangiaceae bacterium]